MQSLAWENKPAIQHWGYMYDHKVMFDIVIACKKNIYQMKYLLVDHDAIIWYDNYRGWGHCQHAKAMIICISNDVNSLHPLLWKEFLCQVLVENLQLP